MSKPGKRSGHLRLDPKNAGAILNKTVRLDCLSPHPKNYNVHPPEQIETLRASIREFGQVQSVVVQAPKRAGEPYTSIAGHGVCEAMRQEGLKRVKADIIPSSWSYAKALAYLAAANETAKYSDPDTAQLARIVADVAQAEGEALAKLAAGDANALRALLGTDTPISFTSTDRDNQGISSTWDQVKNTKRDYILIGDLEIRLPTETVTRLSEYLKQKFSTERKPIHETANEFILTGLANANSDH